MEKHKIDDLFSAKLGDFEATPSMDAWNQVAGNLEANRRTVWFKRLSLAASITLVVLSGYYLFQSQVDPHSDLDFYIIGQSDSAISPEMEGINPALPLFIIEQEKETESINSIQDVKIVSSNSEINQKTEVNKNEPAVNVLKDTQRVELIASLDESEYNKIKPVLTENDVSSSTLTAPPDESEPVVLASNSNVNEPIQIIYKQGEVQEKSKISKALTFMDDVRKGDKKLLNFNKLKGNLFAKNKEDANNSK